MDNLTITDCEIYQYAIPLKSPITIGKLKIAQREGLLLKLSIENAEGRNFMGWGEAAPLLGRSRESLDQCIESVHNSIDFIKNKRISLDCEIINNVAMTRWPNALQAGIEMAIFDVVQQVKSFNFPPTSTVISSVVNVSALLNGDKSQVLRDFTLKYNAGFRSFKLKVGPSVEEDIDLIIALHQLLQDDCSLHLDANQSWSLETAKGFVDKTRDLSIEYIEDPLKNLHGLKEFIEYCPYPVALDEPLLHISIKDLKLIENLGYIIIKPTLIGGFSQSIAWINAARTMGIEPVISSSYETEIGLYHLAMFVQRMKILMPAGLDTLNNFDGHILNKSLEFHNARVDLNKIKIDSMNINFGLLKKIS